MCRKVRLVARVRRGPIANCMAKIRMDLVQICNWFKGLVVLILAAAVPLCPAAIGPVTSITTVNPNGTIPYNLLSITVGDYTVNTDQLAVGTSTSGLTTSGAPLPEMDTLDIHSAINRGTSGNQLTTVLFDGRYWVDTNGDNPDFFLFECGGNDNPLVAAILPGGNLGQNVHIPEDWMPLGYNRLADPPDGHTCPGQSIEGMSWAITDLLDASGNSLDDNSMIEGIAITRRNGTDPTCLCAVVGGEILAAHSPNPPDGATVLTTPLLSWAAGTTAVFHDVYFSTNPTPGPVEYMGRQSEQTYWHGIELTPETTYYWRIDEVDSDGTTIHTGDVWSFWTPPAVAHNPYPADGAGYVVSDVDLGWAEGFGAIRHDVYFGTDETTVADGTGGTFKGTQPNTIYDPGILAKDTNYYWRIDEKDTAGATHAGDVWNFRTLPDIPITDPNLIGWWKLDEGFGATAVDWSGCENHGILTNGPEWVDGYDGGALDFDGVDDSVEIASFIAPGQGTVAFWINPASVSQRARVFGGHEAYESALTAGGAITNELFAGVTAFLTSSSPVTAGEWTHVALTYDSASTLLQIYLSGSLDSQNYTADDSWDGGTLALGQRAGKNREYYEGSLDDFRIYRTVLTQDRIREIMRADPALAGNPRPVDGSTTDIETATLLGWTPGDKAAKHDVYFGTDRDAVKDADISDTTGMYRGRQDPNTHTPPEGVESNQTYYWRIDEHNTDTTISQGKVWRFVVADYLIVDDFESYTNNFGSDIFRTWIDGAGYTSPPPGHPGNGTGSTIGNFNPPFPERAIVHGGKQSMPMDYNNIDPPYYSEAERTWDIAQDWTRRNTGTLTLYFRGYPPSVGSSGLDPGTGLYTLTANGSGIAGASDEFHYLSKRLSGNGTIEAHVLSIGNTDPWAKAGVMIRETLDPNSAHAMAFVTPGNGASFEYRDTKGGDNIGTVGGQTGVTAPHWVRLVRSGHSFVAEHSDDGYAWDALGTPQDIPMAADVYVGLALTSNNTGTTCEAQFSDVATTGSVTGTWQSQDIGINSNVAEQLYVTLEDRTGKRGTVKHTDPNAVLYDTWQEWNIDMKKFSAAGVNTKSVKKMIIGVGDRDVPTPDGTGTLYVDDIRLNQIGYNALNLSKNIVDEGQCVRAGDILTYNICFDNNDNDSAVSNVSIADILSDAVDFVSADGNGVFGQYDPNAHTYTWFYPSLAPGSGDCLKLTVQVRQDADPNTTINNSVTIVSDETLSTMVNLDTAVCELSPLQAEVSILPKLTRRKSLNKLLAVVKLPPGVQKDDLTGDRLVLQPGGIAASHQFTVGGDNRTKIFAFFDGTKILDVVPGYGTVTLTVVGKLKSGQPFYGEDAIFLSRFIGPRLR